MKQPAKKKAPKQEKNNNFGGTGEGIDYCNECPFMVIASGFSICNTSDIVLGNGKQIKVPDWCGNKKNTNEDES